MNEPTDSTAPAPIAREVFDAAALVRDHPPRLHHPHKKLVWRLALPPDRPSRGTIVATRWAAMAPPARVPDGAPHLEVRERVFGYEPAPSETGPIEWYMNFADQFLFGYYGGPLLAQDELQVAEHPALGSLREALADSSLKPLTTEHGLPTPILIRGVERRCAIDTGPDEEAGRPFGLYGNRFARADPGIVEQAVSVLDPPTITNLVAMEAPAYGRGAYTREQIEAVLRTAYTGFRATVLESEGRGAVVHTGFWGCGAYGGNRTLMTELQLVAARLAGLAGLVFHTVDATGGEDWARGRRAYEVDVGASGGALAVLIEEVVARRYFWGESDGN